VNGARSRNAGVLLLCAGLALGVRAGYLNAKAALAGLLLERAWDAALVTGHAIKPWPWADLHPIARLRIPSLRLDQIVLDDANPRSLAFGPAHVGATAWPGASGNVVLAGHRTSWFEPLRGIAHGAEVRLEWRGSDGRAASRVYRVEEIRIVSPDDVSALRSSEQDALTLVTCYPFGYGARSPLRYVVRASALAQGT